MKKLLAGLASLLCLVLALLFPKLALKEPASISGDGLTVHFLDVGQADCILLECDGKALLIDGGNVEDGRMVVSYLKQMGVEKLTAVCTHAHEDHVGGLSAVLSVFPADAVYAPVSGYDSGAFRNFMEKTRAQGLSLMVPGPGERIPFGSAAVTVLGPVQAGERANDASLVLKVSYGESDFLFTGDMELPAETQLLDQWGEDVDWECEVLKVSHHGSDSSSGYRFLYEVNPAYAVISVGKDNSYGHPGEKTLSRLKDAGVTVFRTDRLGHIIARTDGHDITFTWENQNAVPEYAEPADPAMRKLYGNRKSGKFHSLSCRSLPAEHNRVVFDTYHAAIAAGYTPCASCIG